MKVLHVIGSLDIGGAEKLLVDLVPLMNEKIEKCDVLLLNGKSTPLLDKLSSQKKCTIYSLGNSYYNPLYIFRMQYFFKKYDLIHVHLFPAQYIVALAKMLTLSKIPIIFTEHSTSNRRLQHRFLAPLEKFIYKQYSKVVCISSQVKDALLSGYEMKDVDKFVIITNGVNFTDISASLSYNRLDFGYSSTDVLLIMIAAFRHEKDHNTVFEALSLLPGKYKLILAGDGKDRIRVLSEIKKNRLTHRVQVLGNRSDVYSILKMCDISIVSSHWEGFGLVAVESMYSGIPTIASNVKGLAEVVKDGGVLFEKGNSVQLSEEIKKLENISFKKETIYNGYQKAQEFNIIKMIEKLEKLYKKLIYG